MKIDLFRDSATLTLDSGQKIEFDIFQGEWDSCQMAVTTPDGEYHKCSSRNTKHLVIEIEATKHED
jgi:hypothetical protein